MGVDHQPGRITFARKTTMPLPARTWLRKLVVLAFGDAGLEIASLSTKKGPRSCENCLGWH